MSEFIKLPRVCVPLTIDCDFKCKYCYREAGRKEVPEFNQLMVDYLGQLSPEWCEAVIASGGEPLLYPNKVKELFSYVPSNVHKKVMTNGANLTQELVNYFNDLDIEVALSHDGKVTKYIRNCDILEDQDILKLVQQINRLTICGVCTNKNPNPWENYLYTSNILNRSDINYLASPIFEDSLFEDLTSNFDYFSYGKGRFLLWTKQKNPSPKYSVKRERGEGINVLPNGDIVGMTRITHKYGSVLSTLEEIHKAKEFWGDTKKCSKQCDISNVCNCPKSLASDHYCTILHIDEDIKRFIKEYVYI